MALGGRLNYEDRAARISILAQSFAPKPDTLKQTEEGRNAKTLADGAGHTLTGAAMLLEGAAASA
jgi:hypothetical protein